MNINWEKVREDAIVTSDRFIPHCPLGSKLWCVCDSQMNQVIADSLFFEVALLQARELSDHDKVQRLKQ